MRKIIAAGAAAAALALPATAAASHSCGHGIVAANTASCGIAHNADMVWHRDAYGDPSAHGWLYSPATHKIYSADWYFNSGTNRVVCFVHGRGNPWVRFWGLYE